MSTFTRDDDSCRCDGYLTKHRTLCIESCKEHQEEVIDADAQLKECICEGNYTYSSTGQCVCELLGIDELTCVKECGVHQKPESFQASDTQVCVCQNGFVSGDELECACSDILSLDGSSCGGKCSLGEEAIGGQCQCKPDFILASDQASCTCEHFVSLDQQTCVEACGLY